MTPYFMNVDLEIRSISKLEPIIEAFGERVMVVYYGPGEGRKRFLSVECARGYKSPDKTIHALCKIVEELPPAPRRIWDRAHAVFDVGYGLRSNERSSGFSLRPDTLQRVARLGAFLGVTYYRENECDSVGAEE